MLATRRSSSSSAGRPNADKKRSVGRSTPRFDVLDRVGEGALWVVYRARSRASTQNASTQNASQTSQGDETNAPIVAASGPVAGQVYTLKALKNTANRVPRLRQALESCAREALLHPTPGVCVVREVGCEQGTLYLLCDHLPGPSLEALLKRGPLPAARAREITRQLALTLSGLHRGGRFHGDLRPCQILFDDNRRAVLTDTGCAQAFAQAGLSLADVRPEVAYYLAPELSQGTQFSAASDAYALGAVLYQMLTGQVPFDGPSPLAIAARHRADLVLAPSQINPRVDPELDLLALQLLEKEPAQRPSLQTLIARLGPPPATKPPAPGEAAAAAASRAGAASALSNATATSAPVAAPPSEAHDATDSVMATSAALASGASTGVVAASATNGSLATATAATPQASAPRARPMDVVLRETLEREARERQQQNLRKLKRRHRWREFWGFVGSVFGLLLLLVAGAGGALAAYNYWIGDIPTEVVVPPYLNRDQEQARQALSAKGLQMKVVREAFDPNVAAGTVIAGDPEPGRRVRAEREVLVTVSAGQAPIRMVDFARLTLPQAREIITRHGLRLGPVIEQYHDQVPRGFVCGQFPGSGDPLRRSDPITLIVSRGPQPTQIIDATNVFTESDPVVGGPLPGADFAPLQPVTESIGEDGLITRTVTVRVTIPGDAGDQLMRVIVLDARGERTAYQKLHPAGMQLQRAIKVVRAPSEIAVLRVYLGDTLVREEEI